MHSKRNKDFQGLLLPMKISILQFHVKVSRPFKCVGGERFAYCSTFLQEVLFTSNNGKWTIPGTLKINLLEKTHHCHTCSILETEWCGWTVLNNKWNSLYDWTGLVGQFSLTVSGHNSCHTMGGTIMSINWTSILSTNKIAIIQVMYM